MKACGNKAERMSQAPKGTEVGGIRSRIIYFNHISGTVR
jgi:hypothetical protein